MQFVIHGLAFLGGAGIFVLIIIGVSMVITELLENRRSVIIRYESYRFKQHIRIALRISFQRTRRRCSFFSGSLRIRTLKSCSKAWLKAREEQTPPVVDVKAGPWAFGTPCFVDSQDCMGNTMQYWRVWAERNGVNVQLVCGTGATALEALSACRKRTRTKAEVLYARSKPGSGCCDTYCDNMSCDCLKEALDA
jgi:hypothetical protein